MLVLLVSFSWWSVHHHHTDWHIWSGCAILTLLVFRLLWGLVGSSTARFANFVRGPLALREYLRGRWTGIGHNPIGALSVVTLILALSVQVGLGLVSEDEDGLYMGPLAPLVNGETSDKARDLHALWFYVVLGLIGLHLIAILVYRLRGVSLTLPMITGRARIEAGLQPMKPGKWWVALICFAGALAATRWVIAGAPPFGP
jgi:cytochrome b